MGALDVQIGLNLGKIGLRPNQPRISTTFAKCRDSIKNSKRCLCNINRFFCKLKCACCDALDRPDKTNPASKDPNSGGKNPSKHLLFLFIVMGKLFGNPIPSA